jgi:phosphopantetheinyl transferase (holo-ACP synthase)
MHELTVGSLTVLVDAAPADADGPVSSGPLIGFATARAASVDIGDVTVVHRCRTCGSADHGQPFVQLATRGAAEFSVSFARAAGVQVAVAREGGAIGIDIDSATRISAHPVDAVLLHPAEESALAALPPSDARIRRAQLWVAKEALTKAAGLGLRADLREIQLEIAGEQASVRRWQAELALTRAPEITLFAVSDDLVGAIAEL